MTEKVYSFPLYDQRRTDYKVKRPPTVHIARGFDERLPFLVKMNRPLICISDWQCETETQEHFWEQACRILEAEVGGPDRLSSALVLVAGDMASADNRLMGSASDAPPNLHWLYKTFESGDIFMIYGNHDDMAKEHLSASNDNSESSSGLPCLVPHGEPVTFPIATENEEKAQNKKPANKKPPTPHSKKKLAARPTHSKLEKRGKQWRRDNPEQAKLVDEFASREYPQSKTTGQSISIAGIHGIPASHTQGMKKIERKEYFETLEGACRHPIDILMTHSNPEVPGQNARSVEGDGGDQMYECFRKSSACLHVYGHMHADPAVVVTDDGKVVANSDCRVIAFVPNET